MIQKYTTVFFSFSLTNCLIYVIHFVWLLGYQAYLTSMTSLIFWVRSTSFKNYVLAYEIGNIKTRSWQKFENLTCTSFDLLRLLSPKTTWNATTHTISYKEENSFGLLDLSLLMLMIKLLRIPGTLFNLHRKLMQVEQSIKGWCWWYSC